jgi:hypothetical protein
MDRYYRKVISRVDFLLETSEVAQDNPRDFICEYERTYREGFPFWWARKNTEFGDAFGRDLSPEDAEWGKYRPIDRPAPRSIKSLEDRIEEMMMEMPFPATPADQKPICETEDSDIEPW